jgi:hypothetical protein
MRGACACMGAGVFVRSCELPWVTARACSVPLDAFHTSVVSVVSGLGQVTQFESVSTTDGICQSYCNSDIRVRVQSP